MKDLEVKWQEGVINEPRETYTVECMMGWPPEYQVVVMSRKLVLYVMILIETTRSFDFYFYVFSRTER